MKASRSMLTLVVIATGCNAPAEQTAHTAPEPVVVHTARGGTVQLPIDDDLEHEVDGNREQFRSHDGTVWSVQTIDPTASGVGTSLDEIAIALCRRVELGEVEGELTHRDCTFGGQSAQCIEGWQMNHAGERILRRGAIVAAGEDIVWISVAARESVGGLDGLAEALANDTRVAGPL